MAFLFILPIQKRMFHQLAGCLPIFRIPGKRKGYKGQEGLSFLVLQGTDRILQFPLGD
jgi:hypothetical protein